MQFTIIFNANHQVIDVNKCMQKYTIRMVIVVNEQKRHLLSAQSLFAMFKYYFSFELSLKLIKVDTDRMCKIGCMLLKFMWAT